MIKKTLVILAAGIGSRFGCGIKQLEPVDDFGHIIIDYSIHDAICAGFNSIIFIIRHDIEDEFRSVIGNRIEGVCNKCGVNVLYAFQDIDNCSISVPEGRLKPWGTGHAVLSCDGIIDSAFAVINADDYYGKSGFIKASKFLETQNYGLVGYVLKNTLSENGGVTRGICTVDNGKLVAISETKNIIKTETGAEAGGVELDVESLVSMNFLCYPKEFMDVLKAGFPKFLKTMNNPLTDEYLLPVIADEMMKTGTEITVLPTNDRWFGVTYKEDKPAVVENFRKLIAEGIYRADLYSDL